MEISSTLLLECMAGNEDAWQELIRLTSGRLRRIAAANLRERDWIEDMVQETYYKVFRSLHGLRNRERFYPWMVCILVNECRMLERKLRRERRNVGDDNTAMQSLNTESQEGAEDLRQVLTRLLDRLPPTLREILVLREVEGLDYEEISQVLRIPPGTVRSRLSRARAKWIELAQAVMEDTDLLNLFFAGGDSVA